MKRHWGDSAEVSVLSHPVNKVCTRSEVLAVCLEARWNWLPETWEGGHLCPHQPHPRSGLWRCTTRPVRGPAGDNVDFSGKYAS